MRRDTQRDNAHSDKGNFRLIKLLVSLVLLCVVFVAGFLLRGNADFMQRIGMGPDSSQDTQNPGMTVSGSTYDSLSARVAEVQGVLGGSMDSYDLDIATNDVLASIADATGDSSVRYYDQSHYATYLKEITASYSGVGILFGEDSGAAYAVDVFSGSEAESKGVAAGDYVVAIDGDRGNDGWTAAEVVKSVTRDQGSTVVMTFRHPATPGAQGGEEYTVTLTCTDYEEPNVTTELDNDSVGYIKLAQITSNADALVAQAISDLAAQGATSFVLDLRDNPGGYLTQAVDIASLFVRSGTAVQIQSSDQVSSRTVSGSPVTDAPVVVLVNGNTAATAEVLAAALSGNNRATVVGTTTMGKGSVQSVTELSFGGALRYTSAYYLTPEGYAIDGAGITPDVEVADSGDSSTDNQKNVALETAQSLAA